MNIFYVEKVKEDEEEGFEDFVVLNAVGELDKKPSADTAPGMAKDPSQMTEAEINAMYGLDDLDGTKDPYADEDEDSFEDEEYY
jgi:hypothetical protein